MAVELIVLGLSHRTAPVAMRESLAIDPTEAETFVKGLLNLPAVGEATVVSTCNRVEIYAATTDRGAAFDAMRSHLAGRLAGDAATLGELDVHLYRRAGTAAIHHLFRVASSLDSLVVGEPQILGQVKDAYDLAARAGSAGVLLGDCFSRAFRIARRVRRDTEIARQSVSVSSVAVELARQVFDGFEGRRVLLIGAGKMADLAGRALKAQGASVAVTNRTRARAEEFGQRLGFAVEPFEELDKAIGRADIVITSTGARQPILSKADLTRIQKARRNRALVIVDIAVPRDVQAGASEVPGVYLWDIDDLQKEAASGLAGRREEAEKAEVIVEEEVSRYLQSQRGRGVAPTIAALRSRFLSVAKLEADKTLAQVPDADDRTRKAIERLAESIAAKLLHNPQVVLKKEAAGDMADVLTGAVAQLFDLPVLDQPDQPTLRHSTPTNQAAASLDEAAPSDSDPLAQAKP